MASLLLVVRVECQPQLNKRRQEDVSTKKHKMSKIFSTLLFVLVTSFNLLAQTTYVFIGSYCADKTTEGVYVYKLNEATGALTKITSIKNIINPSYLALSPNGKYVYSCTETATPEDGGVSSFEFNAKDKSLTFLSRQKSGGDNPAHISVHKNGKWLMCGNYSGGSLSVFPLSSDGKIEPFTQMIEFKDSGVVKNRQEKSHIHQAVFSPNYDYVFFPDLGSDKIRNYKFDGTKTMPLLDMENPYTKTAAGSGPRHFDFHPNGKFAYCVEELSGTLSAYSYKAGKLENIQTVYAYSEKHSEGFGGADVHISPDGKFLYASNRGIENNIGIFSIGANGKLKLVGHQSTLGNHPRNFSLDPTGKFLLVANKNTGEVVVFKRNATTGLLTDTGHQIKLSNPSCVKMRVY